LLGGLAGDAESGADLGPGVAVGAEAVDCLGYRGVDLWMGHSSSRAALIYQHATGDRDEVIAAAMGEAFHDRRLIDGHIRHESTTSDHGSGCRSDAIYPVKRGRTGTGADVNTEAGET
jgi:hypothetical protein